MIKDNVYKIGINAIQEIVILSHNQNTAHMHTTPLSTYLKLDHKGS